MITQNRSWWLSLFGYELTMAALVAIWGPPVFAFFQLVIGHVLLGIAIFVAWLPAFWWVVRECDRQQLVRRWLAVASTIAVIAIFSLIVWGMI